MKSVYEIITDRILNSLEAGEIPWRRPWTTAGFAPTNLVSKKAYRGINVLLLEGAFESPYWVTFNQCRALGGHVLKGEKATPIVFWKKSQYSTEDADGEEETRSSFLLRYYSVFNVEQTSLKAAAKQLHAEEKANMDIPSCESVVAGYVGHPEIKHKAQGRAFYSPVLDIVTMPTKKQFDNSEGYYATLFHELIHSTGHSKRLARTEWAQFGSESYAKEELVAEIGAAFLCGITDITKPALEENTVAYLQHWIKAIKADPKLVVKAAAAAQTAADLILNRKPAVKVEDERKAA